MDGELGECRAKCMEAGWVEYLMDAGLYEFRAWCVHG